MKNIKLKYKMMLIPVIVAISLVILYITITSGMTNLDDKAYKASAANKIIKNMLDSRISEKNYVRRKDPQYVAEVENFAKTNIEITNDLETRFSDPANKQQAINTHKAIDEYAQAFKDYTEVREQSIKSEEDMVTQARIIEDLSNRARDEQKKQRQALIEANAPLDQIVNKMEKASLTNRIVKDLKDMRIAEKNYIRRKDQKYVDEINQLIGNINKTAMNLKADFSRPENKQMMDDIATSVNAYKKAFFEYFDLREKSIQLSATMKDKARTAVDQAVAIRADQKQQREEIKAELEATMITIFVLIGIIAIAFSLYITGLIVNPIHRLAEVMRRVSDTGEFRHRVEIHQKDELGEMAEAFNALLINSQQAIEEANTVVSAIANGEFDKRVTTDLKGDLHTLKEGVNGSAESVDFMMSELGKIMDALYNGNFTAQMDPKVAGEFRARTENALGAINQTINGIIEVMDQMQQGQFQHRITVEARGDLLKLKNGVNNSMDSLENAIQDITRIMVGQSNGDLTQKITAEYQGELQVLKEAINQTAEKLIEVVSEAVSTSDVVSNAAQEVTKGALDLSQRVQEQAASLEETSATMDEMNTAVQNNTENATEAANLSEDVQGKANQGVQVMQKTIEAMNAIQESSHKISEIVSLIDGIAFQTNLLALNAAVEAARAGEHGRGFAVVASEVRALAQKSAEAAKDIKSLIEESVTRIGEGTELASQSGDMLNTINSSITSVAEMISQIASASAEQARGVSQVHQAISQIDHVTQQNAALVEQTSAASESMSEQATGLRNDMSFFNTGVVLHQSSSQPTKRPIETKPETLTLAKPVKSQSAPAPTRKQEEPSSNEWSDF
ncbi:methyl-accepting chemotaxis protein [Thiomicrorhabdus sp.]|uniref:methyl-accepting chemotaxis protein n=1 Tax=Thiomicrorhabdus sp. TaxID=2039724 RepID=UPI00356A259B